MVNAVEFGTQLEDSFQTLMEYSIEEINNMLKDAPLASILAIIERVSSQDIMDDTSIVRIDEINKKIKKLNEWLKVCQNKIDFAKMTNAPRSELDQLWQDYANIDMEIDNLSGQAESIYQAFDDKKQAIKSACCNAISSSPLSSFEDYRASLIKWLEDQIVRIEAKKRDQETTKNTLESDRDYTAEDEEVKKIEREINKIRASVLEGKVVLNGPVIEKIKGLRAKKSSLEHETFTFVCTEKIKKTLKRISNDITKLQMELYNLMRMDISELKNMILGEYTDTKVSITYANLVRIYRSYVANVVNVPLDLKEEYRKNCDRYSKILDSIEEPTVDNEPLEPIENELKELYNYRKSLLNYKQKPLDYEKENKFLYTSIRNAGLMELPFDETAWHTYFGEYYDTLANSISRLKDINGKYSALISNSLRSKKDDKKLEGYREELEYLLDELYNKVLSLYLKTNCYINVNIYDYRDNETLSKYIEYLGASIDEEVANVDTKIETLNQKKQNIITFVNDKYSEIEHIKHELNSILKGEHHQELSTPKQVVQEKESVPTMPTYSTFAFDTQNATAAEPERNSSFFDNAIGLDFENVSKEAAIPSRANNHLSKDTTIDFDPTNIFGIENNDDESVEPDINTKQSSSSKLDSITQSKETSTNEINFDDIFASSQDNIIDFETKEEQQSHQETIPNAIEEAEFKDLLEPKAIQEPNNIVSTKPKRGLLVKKIEPVIETAGTSQTEPVISDAEAIKERIINGQAEKKEKIAKPVLASEVGEEYNESTAPINLSDFLNGTLRTEAPVSPTEIKEPEEKLSQKDNDDLAAFLMQITANDKNQDKQIKPMDYVG